MKKLLYISLVFASWACREDFAFKKEIFELLPSTKIWQIDTKNYKVWDFADSIGNKKSISLNNESRVFTPSKTTIAGIPTNISKFEQITQTYIGIGLNYTMILTGYNEPTGNMLSIAFDKTNLVYRLNKFEIQSLYFDNTAYTNQNASFDGMYPNITSILKFDVDYKLKNKVFPKVLHFTLKDGKPKNSDMVELVLAPQAGILFFKTKDGTKYWRDI